MDSNRLLKNDDIDPITVGTSLRYREDNYIIYEFKWLSSKNKFDTKSFNQEHTFPSDGVVYTMTKRSVDSLANEIVEHMKKKKSGKYYQPKYKEYFITLLVYFLTWEVIAAAVWYFWLKDSALLLFSLPGLFVLLAIISIIDEIKKKKKDSFTTPFQTIRNFEREFKGGNVKVNVEREYKYLKVKFLKPQKSTDYAEVKPIKPYTPGPGNIRNRGRNSDGNGLNNLKLPGDSPVEYNNVDAKGNMGGMNYPENDI